MAVAEWPKRNQEIEEKALPTNDQKKANNRHRAELAATSRPTGRPQVHDAEVSSDDNDNSFDIEAWGEAELNQQESARAASSAPVQEGTVDEDEDEEEDDGFDLEAWGEDEVRAQERARADEEGIGGEGDLVIEW